MRHLYLGSSFVEKHGKHGFFTNQINDERVCRSMGMKVEIDVKISVQGSTLVCKRKRSFYLITVSHFLFLKIKTNI